MKAIDILTMYDNLSTLIDKDIDLNTAINIAKNIKSLSAAKEVIEKKRNNLIKEYAEKDDNGEIIQDDKGQIKITNIVEFNSKISEITETDVDIELISIKKSALSDIKISPKVVMGILNILEE